MSNNPAQIGRQQRTNIFMPPQHSQYAGFSKQQVFSAAERIHIRIKYIRIILFLTGDHRQTTVRTDQHTGNYIFMFNSENHFTAGAVVGIQLEINLSILGEQIQKKDRIVNTVHLLRIQINQHRKMNIRIRMRF